MRRRLNGSRVLCISNQQILLVQHEDPRTGGVYWVLPGGGRDASETFEQAAIREVQEETGLRVQLVRRLRVPRHVPEVSYALFLAIPRTHTEPTPIVDLRTERYLRATAWHQISAENPLGPLHPAYWGYLEQRIRRLLAGQAHKTKSRQAG